MEWWGWVAAVLSGLILIANGIKAVKELLSPAFALEERVAKIEKHDQQDIERFAVIEERFEEYEATNQAILKGLVALINHEIDGNGIEGLKNTRNDLLKHIIER